MSMTCAVRVRRTQTYPRLAPAPEQDHLPAAEAGVRAAPRRRRRRAVPVLSVRRAPSNQRVPEAQHGVTGHVHRVGRGSSVDDRPGGACRSSGLRRAPARRTPGGRERAARWCRSPRCGRRPPRRRRATRRRRCPSTRSLRASGSHRARGQVNLGGEQPARRDHVEAAALAIDRDGRRQDPPGRVGRLGVLGAGLDAVDLDRPDPAVLVERAGSGAARRLPPGPARSRDRRGPGASSPSSRRYERRATTFLLLASTHRSRWCPTALAGDRHHAVRADPADREPSMPADPRHAHRPPAAAMSTKWMRASRPALRRPLGARRSGEREPAPVRRDAQVGAAAERADRAADLLERLRVRAGTADRCRGRPSCARAARRRGLLRRCRGATRPGSVSAGPALA